MIKNFKGFLAESIVTDGEREFISFIKEYGEDKIREDVEKFIEEAKKAGFPDDALQNAREVYDYKKPEPSESIEESVQFPHEIKSEKFWKQILVRNDFALKILDTVMKRQKGFASDRQMEVLRRVEKGDKSPYNTKN